MTTINDAYQSALLADATYALDIDGLQNKTGFDLEGYLNTRMTPTVAQYIGDHYTVVTHIETDDAVTSGFDATVSNRGQIPIIMMQKSSPASKWPVFPA